MWKSSSKRFNKTSSERFKQSSESFKKAWELYWKVWKWLKEIPAALWNTLKWSFEWFLWWDKKIWEEIEQWMIEKGKDPSWRLKKFLRNNILKISLLLSASGVISWVEIAKNWNEKHEDNTEISINEEKWDSNELLYIPTWEYDLLNWKKITTRAPLTRRYLWWDLQNSWDLIINDTLTLNPAHSLHNLWTKKIVTYGQSTKDITTLDAIDVTKMTPEEIEDFRIKYPIDATYLFVIRPYIDWHVVRNTMSLDDFIKESNKIVNDIRTQTESYDWWLTWSKKKLFNSIRNDINWECIVAYAMTELCENKEDWNFNKQLFDILLQNSWVNYLANIPAIYDWKTSYWFYQFTEYALYENKWDVRWASVVNSTLPKEQRIPGSVIDLKSWEDQTKAAYMFAIYNLNAAIKKLSEKQAKDLLEYKKNNNKLFMNNMTQLIAMCHHYPVDADALKKWHEANHVNDIYNYGRAQSYGKATKINYSALRK